MFLLTASNLTHLPLMRDDTINFCSGKASSLEQIIEICKISTSHSPEIVVNPAYVRRNEIKVLEGDNSKLLRIAGVKNITGIEETIRWMLAYR